MLKTCYEWLTLRSVDPILAEAQLRQLQRQIPLLYALLIVNAGTAIYIFQGAAPDWLGLWIPTYLIGWSLIRIAKWLKTPVLAFEDRDAVRVLRQTVLIATVVTAAYLTWSLELSAYGNVHHRMHLAIFIAITVIGCLFCLMHLPQAALVVAAIVIGPCMVYYVSPDDAIYKAIGFNILLVMLLMLRGLLNNFDGFTKLVHSQKETRHLNAEITKLAHTDMLTGLPNRRSFFSEADRAIARCRTEGADLAVGVIDLDRFKAANDTYGHLLGDQILEVVGARLKEAFRNKGMVARLGGDEFAFVFEGDRASALDVAIRACERVSQPFRLGEVSISIGATCGIAMTSDVSGDSRALYDGADYALYAAKNQRRGFAVLYSPEHEQRIRSERAVEAALQTADLAQEMVLHLQPIASSACETILCVEALARWTSPHLGRIGPDVFIPAAEKAGIIHRLTLTLLDKALACLKVLPDDMKLSFNLSAHDITNHETVSSIMALVIRSDVAPTRLVMELTETAVLRDFGTAEASIRLLRSLGIQISLDDFGTGQSSLSYLRRLPIDKVKIDRSFMADARDGEARELLSAVVAFCKSMRMQCVAEGVEEVAQLRLLKAIGCDEFQGYLLARPMPIEELTRWTAERSRPDGSVERLCRA